MTADDGRRVGLFVASGIAVISLGAAGLIQWLIVLAVLGMLLVAHGPRSGTLERARTTVRPWRLLVFPLTVVPAVALSGQLTQEPRVVALASLVSATAVVLALKLVSRRDRLMALGLDSMMMVLALGTGSGSGLILLVTAGAVVVLLVLIGVVQAPADSVAEQVARVAITDDEQPPRVGVLRRQLAVVTGLTLVCGAVLFLLVPDTDGVTSASLLGGSVPEPSTEDPVPPREAVTYGGGSIDLRSRGDLPTEPLLLVPEESPEYWRAATMDVYESGSWGESVTKVPQQIPAGVNALPSPQRGSSGLDSSRQTYEVQVLPQYAGTLIAPGDIRVLSSPSESIRFPSGSVFPMDQLDQYTVTSTTTSHVAESIAAPSIAANPSAPEGFTELPNTIPSRVLELGQSLVSNAPDRVSAVAAVEDYVRSSNEYLLDAPVPPEGADPVDYFLFESKLGYCEHFASAEVVLLRAAGIPARLVTGFVNGESTSDGERVFRGVDGHAWVEVWVPGVGWAMSDPTAGAVRADDQSLLSTAISSVTGWLSNERARRYAGLILVGAVFAAAWVARVLASRRRSRRAKIAYDWSTPEPEEPLAAFGRLERALGREGRPREVAETPGELGHRLPLKRESTMATVEQAAYSSQHPSAAASLAAATDLDQLARRTGTVQRKTGQ